jgi:predicted RNA binding protein YcfA (HicA-like mRNA interferase family)
MPRKIRELVTSLERAGWVLDHGGKGSYRKFSHVRSSRKVILSGQLGADALHYQEKQVKQALHEVQK